MRLPIVSSLRSYERDLSDHIEQSGKTRAIQTAATNSGDEDDPATILT
jgi:hypothetical protein